MGEKKIHLVFFEKIKKERRNDDVKYGISLVFFNWFVNKGNVVLFVLP